MFPVTGDTYELREQLKAMGCRWDADAKCWLAPDASTQASAQAMADAEPLRKWREFAGTLAWCVGSFTPTVWDAGLRACSLGLPLAVALAEIGERITSNGGDANPRWLERNVGRAYQHGTPPEWLTPGMPATAARKHDACTASEHASKLPKPTFVETKLTKLVGEWARVIDTAWLADRSPIDPLSTSAEGFLRALYQPGEQVLIADVFKSQGGWLWSHARGFDASVINYRGWDESDPTHGTAPPLKVGPAFSARGPLGIWYLCNPVDGTWGKTAETDKHGRPKWSRRSEPQVTSFRYFALETDTADPREWVAAIAQLELRVAALYTSGNLGKRNSVHVLVRVDAESKAQFDEWRPLAKRTMIPLGADPGCMSAVRLTRLPGCIREGKEDKKTGKPAPFPTPQPQKLLYLDPSPCAAKLIDRTPVRDSLGPWERWVEATLHADRSEIGEEELRTLKQGLANFAGERAARLREELRRWTA